MKIPAAAGSNAARLLGKTGNAHLRRIAIEAGLELPAQASRGTGVAQARQEGVPEEIKEMAWKAQLRLHKRYARLAAAGKEQCKIHDRRGARTAGLSGPSA